MEVVKPAARGGGMGGMPSQCGEGDANTEERSKKDNTGPLDQAGPHCHEIKCLTLRVDRVSHRVANRDPRFSDDRCCGAPRKRGWGDADMRYSRKG